MSFAVSVAAAPGEEAVRRETFGEVVLQAAGLCGWLTVALSLVGISIACHLFLHLRRERWVPAAVAAEFVDLVRQGRLEDARRLCEMDGSFFSQIARVGLARRGEGAEAVERSVQRTAEEQLAPWQRRLGWLGLIATVAPMLGLLGTVIGMIETFGAIKASEGTVEPKDLAGGVEYALVTTYLGLMVAIPHLALHSALQGRLEGLVHRAGGVLGEAFTPAPPGR